MKESPWGKFKREIEQEMISVQELEVAELTDQEVINYHSLSLTLTEELNND